MQGPRWQQKDAPRDTVFSSSPRPAEPPAAGRSPGLHVRPAPPSRPGTGPKVLRAPEDTEDVIWPRTPGPSFRGMSQVRLQVTQIAALCTVPRGRRPGDSTQGQRRWPRVEAEASQQPQSCGLCAATAGVGGAQHRGGPGQARRLDPRRSLSPLPARCRAWPLPFYHCLRFRYLTLTAVAF